MAEYKRVVRDKNGRITGVEVGDPHAPSAADFRSAYQDLLNLGAILKRLCPATQSPASRRAERVLLEPRKRSLSGGTGSLTMPGIRWCETFNNQHATPSKRRKN
jgi:hypothetical protein